MNVPLCPKQFADLVAKNGEEVRRLDCFPVSHRTNIHVLTLEDGRRISHVISPQSWDGKPFAHAVVVDQTDEPYELHETVDEVLADLAWSREFAV